MGNEVYLKYSACVTGVDAQCRRVPVSGTGAKGVCEDGSAVFDLSLGGVTGFGDAKLAAAVSAQVKKLMTAHCASEPAALFASRLTALTACDSLLFSYDRQSAIAAAVRSAREYSRSHYGEGRDGVLYAADELSLRLATAGNACALVFEPVDIATATPRSEKELSDLFTLAAENDLFIIADETRTGIYRTGSVTACAEMGLSPDMLLLGGLAGGLPLTVCLARGEAARVSVPAPDGNPVLCAAGMDIIARFDEGSAAERIKKHAALFKKSLQACKTVKLTGAHGMHFSLTAEKYSADAAARRLSSKGVLVRKEGEHLVLLPPLNITPQQIKEVCALIDEALQ